MAPLLEKIIRRFCFYTWRFWERLGVHVIPNHFYFPVLDSRKLASYDFNKVFACEGIDFEDEQMLKLIPAYASYYKEYEPLHKEVGYSSNGDGAILYGMIRHLKPKRVVEVGSGYSTQLVCEAAKKNSGEGSCSHEAQVTCIEPYPKPVLKELEKNKKVILIEDKVEETDPAVFEELESGDVLFIDSSHVVDTGNDVHFLYLELLPKIPVGVYVHIHDIRLPYEYPKSWVLNAHKHWGEQYLLHMFLSFNNSFEVVFASNYMFERYKRDMVDALYGLDEDGWPGSFWIRRTR